MEGTHTYSAFSVPAFVRDVVNPKTEKTRSGYEVQRKQRQVFKRLVLPHMDTVLDAV